MTGARLCSVEVGATDSREGGQNEPCGSGLIWRHLHKLMFSLM